MLLGHPGGAEECVGAQGGAGGGSLCVGGVASVRLDEVTQDVSVDRGVPDGGHPKAKTRRRGRGPCRGREGVARKARETSAAGRSSGTPRGATTGTREGGRSVHGPWNLSRGRREATPERLRRANRVQQLSPEKRQRRPPTQTGGRAPPAAARGAPEGQGRGTGHSPRLREVAPVPVEALETLHVL